MRMYSVHKEDTRCCVITGLQLTGGEFESLDRSYCIFCGSQHDGAIMHKFHIQVSTPG